VVGKQFQQGPSHPTPRGKGEKRRKPKNKKGRERRENKFFSMWQPGNALKNDNTPKARETRRGTVRGKKEGAKGEEGREADDGL